MFLQGCTVRRSPGSENHRLTTTVTGIDRQCSENKNNFLYILETYGSPFWAPLYNNLSINAHVILYLYKVNKVVLSNLFALLSWISLDLGRLRDLLNNSKKFYHLRDRRNHHCTAVIPTYCKSTQLELECARRTMPILLGHLIWQAIARTVSFLPWRPCGFKLRETYFFVFEG